MSSMSNDNWTLKQADASPKGGNDERARFEAWASSKGLGVTRKTGGDYSWPSVHTAWVAWQAALAARPKGVDALQIPDNEDTRQILGRLNFQCYHIAQVLRMRGDAIPTASEREQAAVIGFLLNHYLASPTEWRANVNKELNLIMQQATGPSVES